MAKTEKPHICRIWGLRVKNPWAVSKESPFVIF